MRAVDALAVSILILGSTGCASLDSALEPKAGQELRPFAVGWEQFFTIDWQPTERKGQPALEGIGGEPFSARPLLAFSFLVEDSTRAGRVINQRVIWLGPASGPSNRVEFWTPVTRSPEVSPCACLPTTWRDKGGGV